MRLFDEIDDQATMRESWRVHYDKVKDVVVILATGNAFYHDMSLQARKAVALSRQHATNLVLADFSDAQVELSFADINRLPAFFATIGVPQTARLAVITPRNAEQRELLEFLELRCRSAFYNVCLFGRHEAAENWLQKGRLTRGTSR